MEIKSVKIGVQEVDSRFAELNVTKVIGSLKKFPNFTLVVPKDSGVLTYWSKMEKQ